jgi:hypothetical protein
MVFKPHRANSVVFFVLFAVLAIFGVAFLSSHTKNNRVLEIRDINSGRLYSRRPLGRGEFAIEFVHSVNQSPVREFFTVEGRTIRPKQVRFSSFGAGMQSDLQEGQTLTRDGDALIISGFSTSFKELNYIVGTVSDHLLFINDEALSLRDLCGRNAHIRICIK